MLHIIANFAQFFLPKYKLEVNCSKLWADQVFRTRQCALLKVSSATKCSFNQDLISICNANKFGYVREKPAAKLLEGGVKTFSFSGETGIHVSNVGKLSFSDAL